ncbi:hypothetical protein EJ08DRAFT_78144 [Tothia fuscella]|uniref:TUG ubiquitin-like domain-containing protein n=1 Tax=Tothia fuscella TaxID=1048955 RepID=A0A9P4NXA0_9PEZI|nr:hypothetical protein EJ08DRAFT_78144 [Tothia fuscella]
MASNVVVIDSTFRRANVKVQPQTHLSDVLEEACKKLNLRSEQYGLKHNKKNIDLSLTYRLSGLHSGAQLELVQVSRSPAVVNIALQLPSNQRLTEKFPSSTTLWQILRRFESGAAGGSGPDAINITQRGIASTDAEGVGAGRLYYEMPVLQVMNRELASFVDLQKTLAQIGVTSGSSLLRLKYRNDGQPLEEAMTQISQYFKAAEEPQTATTEVHGAHASAAGQLESNPVPEPMEEATPSPAAASPLQESQTTASLTAPPAEPQSEPPTDTPSHISPPPPDNSSTLSTKTSPPPTKSSVKVYQAPSSDTPTAAQTPHNPNDYIPTIDHAKIHQSRLNDLSRNRRLPSDKEIAKDQEEKQAALAAVQQVKVRIRLPDQNMLEDTFDRSATAADLYDVVRLALRYPEQTFLLKYTDSKGKHTTLPEGPRLLIRDLQWRGSTVIYMIWGDDVSDDIKKQPNLNDEFTNMAKALTVEQPLSQESEEPEEKRGMFGQKLGGKDAKGKGGGNLSSSEKAARLKGMLFGKKK